MHIVAVHGWQKEDAEVAGIIAEAMGTVAFEARQKISAGGPAVIAVYADAGRAASLAASLSPNGVPAMVLDSDLVRNGSARFPVSRFRLQPQSLPLKSTAGETCSLDWAAIELLLVAAGSSGPATGTDTLSERKFSLGRTLLAGGLPMTKKVTRKVAVTTEERDETLWLYSRGRPPLVFDRAVLVYDGFGAEMAATRELNFNRLKSELRRLAPQAVYDDRLLSRARLTRLLGPALDPRTDLDLAFAILAGALRA